MSIAIDPYEYFAANEYRYGDMHFRLIAYKARFGGGTITLTDHDEYLWVNREDLQEYAFAPRILSSRRCCGREVRSLES